MSIFLEDTKKPKVLKYSELVELIARFQYNLFTTLCSYGYGPIMECFDPRDYLPRFLKNYKEDKNGLILDYVFIGDFPYRNTKDFNNKYKIFCGLANYICNPTEEIYKSAVGKYKDIFKIFSLGENKKYSCIDIFIEFKEGIYLDPKTIGELDNFNNNFKGMRKNKSTIGQEFRYEKFNKNNINHLTKDNSNSLKIDNSEEFIRKY